MTRLWIYRRDAETPSLEGNPSLRPRLALRSNRGKKGNGMCSRSRFWKPRRCAEGAEGAEFHILVLSASGRPLPLRAGLGGERSGRFEVEGLARGVSK